MIKKPITCITQLSCSIIWPMATERGFLEKHVRKLYKTVSKDWDTDPLKEIVDQTRAKFLKIDEEDFTIDRDFLTLLALDPSLTYALHITSARTTDRFLKAVREQNSKLVEESHFFIDHCQGKGIVPTVVVDKPAAYDLPAPRFKTVEDETRTNLAHVHAHPPLRDVLAPSVLIETAQGYKGDLYALSATREMNRQDVQNGKKPTFTNRQLFIILQDNLNTQEASILFIRQTEQLASLDLPTYIQKLRESTKFFEEVPNIQTVCQYLRQLNFRASHVTLDFSQYYGYPFFEPYQLERLADDLKD